MAKLILRGEDGAEQELELDESGSVTIGRSPDCDIPIADAQASRRHCSVVRLQSGYELADLGSTNGTLLNSTLVKRKRLKHGDVIRIGHVEIAFHDPDSAGAAPSGETENCVLVFARGERKGDKIELIEQRTTLGRKETNTIPLRDPNTSSYHCEVVRDLNGYTIRDLGSTNGTLVNNEMVTEAQLSHGARIRIGSVRFVFQDPALAEIDLELAGVDDDESDWGMMRELDLAAVRKRHPMTYVYLVIFVLLVAGGYFVTTIDIKEQRGGPVERQGNLIEDFSFESPAAAFDWESDQPGDVELKVATKVKAQGASSLEVSSGEAEATVLYGQIFPGDDARYEIEGKLAARGGAKARVGLLWSGQGLSTWDLSDLIDSSSLTTATLTAEAPPWASTARLGVRIEGKGTVFLDDFNLVRAGSSRPATIEQNLFRFTVVNGSDLDITHLRNPVLAKGRVFAQGADAAGLTVGVEPADGIHVRVTIGGGAGATVVGLELEDVRGYLTVGGFRAFAPDQTPSFHGTFPDEGTLPLEGVRKVLLGPKGKALALLPDQQEGRLRCEARVEGSRRILSVLGTPGEDGTFAFRVKTDLTGEAAVASKEFTQALTLFNEGRWGEFLETAQRVLAEFPFASPARQKQLREKMDRVIGEYGALVSEADAMIEDYKEFRDLQSLDRVREILGIWSGKFQVVPGEGPRGARFAKFAESERSQRFEAERKRQGKVSKAVLEIAQYVAIPQGENYSAAVLLSYIVKYLPASAEAEQARTLLTGIEKEHPDVLAVLESLGLRGE